VAQARGLLEMVEQEMQDYFGDRSQEWQESERGESFQERIDAMTEAKDRVEALASA